jgi:hypothetical protein
VFRKSCKHGAFCSEVSSSLKVKISFLQSRQNEVSLRQQKQKANNSNSTTCGRFRNPNGQHNFNQIPRFNTAAAYSNPVYVIKIHFHKGINRSLYGRYKVNSALTVSCFLTDATLFMPASPYLVQEVQHGVTVANIASSWGANNSRRFLCADRYEMFHNHTEHAS